MGVGYVINCVNNTHRIQQTRHMAGFLAVFRVQTKGVLQLDQPRSNSKLLYPLPLPDLSWASTRALFAKLSGGLLISQTATATHKNKGWDNSIGLMVRGSC